MSEWQKVLNHQAIEKLTKKWDRTFQRRSYRRVLRGVKLTVERDDRYILARLGHDVNLQREWDHARQRHG